MGKNGKIFIRSYPGNSWIEVSLKGDCDGIMPGDLFISPSDGMKSMIIGFSDSSVFGLKDPLAWGIKKNIIWALKKDWKEAIVGCFERDRATFNEIKSSIVKAKIPIIAETAAETIANFQNG